MRRVQRCKRGDVSFWNSLWCELEGIVRIVGRSFLTIKSNLFRCLFLSFSPLISNSNRMVQITFCETLRRMDRASWDWSLALVQIALALRREYLASSYVVFSILSDTMLDTAWNHAGPATALTYDLKGALQLIYPGKPSTWCEDRLRVCWCSRQHLVRSGFTRLGETAWKANTRQNHRQSCLCLGTSTLA